MNAIQLRKVNPPLTPNLEEYKQKNKSKSRRKGPNIQPTNPPTPKMPKQHVHLKPTNDKHLEAKEQPAFCQLHPDRPVVRYLDPNNKYRQCARCYFLTNEDQGCKDEVQSEKKKELNEFRGKIKQFGLRLQEADECIKRCAFQSEQNYYQQKDYIHEAFKNLRIILEQKERELINVLIVSQQQIKKSMNRSSFDVEEVKKAINRYMEDIENNYNDIIESLSYQQFTEIIDKYNAKIKYFQQGIEDICLESSLNVYIPKKEIEKLISKATVQVYPELVIEEPPTPYNRTLQRYTTQKNNLYLDAPNRGYLSQHQESINTKLSQHRQSRDRQFFCGRVLSSKQNYNFDNHIFH